MVIDGLLKAVIEDAPMESVADAERLLLMLVDQTDPDDKIGWAIGILQGDRDEQVRLRERAELKAKVVVCKLCKERYDSVGPDDVGTPLTQGYGCATSFYRKDEGWCAQGFYGSRLFDMSVMRFTGAELFGIGVPTDELNPVCDICIQQRINCGLLERIGDATSIEDAVPAVVIQAVREVIRDPSSCTPLDPGKIDDWFASVALAVPDDEPTGAPV